MINKIVACSGCHYKITHMYQTYPKPIPGMRCKKCGEEISYTLEDLLSDNDNICQNCQLKYKVSKKSKKIRNSS